MTVTITKDMAAVVLQRVKDLTSQRVLVGIPSAGDTRPDGKIGNAEIGYLMENGEPEHNVPARPWLLPGVEAVQDKTIAQLKKAGEAALVGDDPAAGFIGAGSIAVSSVKQGIVDIIPPPLAPATLAARKAQGNENETPLRDTRSMFDNIVFVVEDKRNG